MKPTPRRALARVASIAAISLLAIAAGPARAQSAEAEQRFVEAEALLSAGKVEEACEAFEESNRLEPRAGTLINLGLCQEKLGKLASALEAFRAALARVKDPRKREIALKRVAALEERVSSVTVSVAKVAEVEGLIVSLDGRALETADHDRPIPVDGGSHTIAASAPGYRRWKTSIEVQPERDQASVSVPELVERGAERGEAAGPPASSASSPSSPSRSPGARRRYRVLMWSGVGVFTLGATYWFYGHTRIRDAEYKLCTGRYSNRNSPEDFFECLDPMKIREWPDESFTPAQRDARVAEINMSGDVIKYDEQGKRWGKQVNYVAAPVALVGGAMALVGLVGYLASGSDDARPATARRDRREVTWAPVIHPDGGGAMVRLDW